MSSVRWRFAQVGLILMCFVQPVPAEQGTDPEVWKKAGVVAIRPPVPSPETTLRDLDGARTSLRDFRDRVVLLYFWTAG